MKSLNRGSYRQVLGYLWKTTWKLFFDFLNVTVCHFLSPSVEKFLEQIIQILIFSRNYFSILAKSDMVKDVGFHTGVPIPLSINSKRIKQKLKKSPTQISYENTKMSYSGSCQLSKHLCTVPYEKNL